MFPTGPGLYGPDDTTRQQGYAEKIPNVAGPDAVAATWGTPSAPSVIWANYTPVVQLLRVLLHNTDPTPIWPTDAGYYAAHTFCELGLVEVGFSNTSEIIPIMNVPLLPTETYWTPMDIPIKPYQMLVARVPAPGAPVINYLVSAKVAI